MGNHYTHGSVKNTCEQVTSGEHSYCQAVSGVGVKVHGDEVFVKATIFLKRREQSLQYLCVSCRNQFLLISSLTIETIPPLACAIMQVGHVQPCYQKCSLFSGLSARPQHLYNHPHQCANRQQHQCPQVLWVQLLHQRVPLLFRQGLVLFRATASAAPNYPQHYEGDDSCQVDVLFESTLEVEGFNNRSVLGPLRDGQRQLVVQWAQIVFKSVVESVGQQTLGTMRKVGTIVL